MSKTIVTIGQRQVKLSNLDKLLYPGKGFTKGDVLDYYGRISGAMLPHLKDRPVSMKRFPDGVESGAFFNKNCPDFRPPWIETRKVDSANDRGYVRYCVINETASLLWVANLAALELHAYQHTVHDTSLPTAMVLDLDPGPPADLRHCARLAVRIAEILNGVNLRCLAKTSGGKGLHLYVPLNTPTTYTQTKNFARALAQQLEKETPNEVLSAMTRNKREGKVFVDWSQNDEHKTTVCAYSLRGHTEPTVSLPLQWEEVEILARRRKVPTVDMSPKEALKRVDEMGDVFAGALTTKQMLPPLPPDQSSQSSA